MDFSNMISELKNIEGVYNKPAHDNIQTQQLVPMIITYIDINGSRPSIEFVKKSHYTFEEVIHILKNIDLAWEYTNANNHQSSYIK